jgi:hypothetical protein
VCPLVWLNSGRRYQKSAAQSADQMMCPSDQRNQSVNERQQGRDNNENENTKDSDRSEGHSL